MLTKYRRVLLVGCLLGLLTCVPGVKVPVVDINDPVATRTVLDYQITTDGTVIYEYQGEPLPQVVVEDELPSYRTESSYTRQTGVTDDGRPILTLTAYELPIFVETQGVWYVRETATTTKTAFYEAYTKGRYAYLFAPRAEAASYSGFSTTADGWYDMALTGDTDFSLPVDFSNCVNGIDALGGAAAPTFGGGTPANIAAQYRSNILGTCEIGRGYLTFDTSSITVGSTLSAATVAIYVTAKTNNENDGLDTITITRPGGTWTTWDVGTASDSFDITAISTSAYTTFTLNATGRGYLTLGGTTELGIQEGHDVAQSPPPGNSATGNIVTFSTSEETGTSQDPTLSVTYTEPAAAVARPVRISEGFRLRIMEGRVIIR